MSENSDMGPHRVLWLGKKHTSGAEAPFFALVWVPWAKAQAYLRSKRQKRNTGILRFAQNDDVQRTTYNVQKQKQQQQQC